MQIVEVKTDRGDIKLSPDIVKRYLVNGNSNAVTDQEITMFMALCKYQSLNPFLKDVYLIKYGSGPASLVVSKDLFLKRANREETYGGLEAGIIILTEKGEMKDRAGTIYSKDKEILAGGWARIHFKDGKKPLYVSVNFDEYCGKKHDGTPTPSWAKMPTTMIRKVAIVQALREAFPENYQGLYDGAEMNQEIPYEKTKQETKDNFEESKNWIDKIVSEFCAEEGPHIEVIKTAVAKYQDSPEALENYYFKLKEAKGE